MGLGNEQGMYYGPEQKQKTNKVTQLPGELDQLRAEERATPTVRSNHSGKPGGSDTIPQVETIMSCATTYMQNLIPINIAV